MVVIGVYYGGPLHKILLTNYTVCVGFDYETWNKDDGDVFTEGVF